MLTINQAHSLLTKYKIKVVNTAIYPKRVNFPLVLKVDSPEILHKSDYGMVIVGIKDEKELNDRVLQLKSMLSERGVKNYSLVVQEMVRGVELLIGMKRDKIFGPVIVFGLGGIFTEIIKDVSMSIAPLKR